MANKGNMKRILFATGAALLILNSLGVLAAYNEPHANGRTEDLVANAVDATATSSIPIAASAESRTNNAGNEPTRGMGTNMEVDLVVEFNRQVANLVQKGYPELSGQSVESFLSQADALKQRLHELSIHGKPGNIPFVIVVKQEWVSLESAMPRVNINGEAGVVNMVPVAPRDFGPIAGLNVPTNAMYLLENIDTGRDTLSVRPEDALQMILKENRSPLTIDEGVALVVQFPQVLTDKRTYNCIQMPGSRRNDQRVPSIWISYGKPRLGWCWDRNKHTWLGSASCSRRIGGTDK
jgi:hypothetical protein